MFENWYSAAQIRRHLTRGPRRANRRERAERREREDLRALAHPVKDTGFFVRIRNFLSRKR